MITDTRIVMGMPVSVTIAGATDPALLDTAFGMFAAVDRQFSPYRDDSEVADLNAGRVQPDAVSVTFREILAIAEAMRVRSDGAFDVRRPDGRIDPSGVVKGWAVQQVAADLVGKGVRDFLIDAGGDIQASGRRDDGAEWRVGIRNPFDLTQVVKLLEPRGRGVATSGSYVRGAHIYDPRDPARVLEDIVSLTVMAADVLEADLLATAAFAMGREGLDFLRRQPGVEFYAIDHNGIATFTPALSERRAA